MLDNFSASDLQQLHDIELGHTKIEVSGNVTAETLKEFLHPSIDFISTGSLTKHVHAVDLSMRFED